MSWSIRLGRLWGIDVYMHLTFLLVLAWIAWMHWSRTGSALETAGGVLFVVAIFGCVLLHEYGHALTARRFGIRTRDITLLPIGGLARLERMPDNPLQEFWVAIAGPAVNLVIAVGLVLVLLVGGGLQMSGFESGLSMTAGPFLARLVIVNLFILFFNMLPAFPMDGGRVVRSLLATRLDFARATRIAGRIGQVMAVIFAVVGLWLSPMLVFIALFVWIGAGQEMRMADARSILDRVAVHQVMQRQFNVLDSSTTIEQASRRSLETGQGDFPILDGGALVGMLDRADLYAAARGDDRSKPVVEVMRADFETFAPQDSLDQAVNRLQARSMSAGLVADGGRVVGMLTFEGAARVLNDRPKGY